MYGELWQDLARCRTVDPEWFFSPEGERTQARNRRIRRAREVCRQCPVIGECAAFALNQREAFGVWGGMSEGERISLMLAAGERPRGRSIHARTLR